MNLKKKKKGFTLIELMAVIAIIAILAAVLVPTVNGYIQRAKKTAIVTQARTVVNAVEAYNATAAEPYIVTLGGDDGITVTPATAENPKVSELAKVIGEDLLDSKSIEKLGNMTLAVARAINEDVDAIKNIKVYPNGVFGQYKTMPVTPEPTNGTGDGGLTGNKLPVYEDTDLK